MKLKYDVCCQEVIDNENSSIKDLLNMHRSFDISSSITMLNNSIEKLSSAADSIKDFSNVESLRHELEGFQSLSKHY